MIVDKKILIKATANNRKRYESLGYAVPTNNHTFEISTLDLSPHSVIVVTRICDLCKGESDVARKYADRPCTCVNERNVEKTSCKCGKKIDQRSTVCFTCKDNSGENNPMFGKKNPKLAEMSSANTGEKHWNWKGGNTKNRSGRVTLWAKKVKALFNYTCDKCGFGNELVLDAHHLDSYSRGNELNYDVNNGVCLCKNCHCIFHKTYGYGDNTKAQYLEFKKESL